eukprot:TRINITY_DN256_c0_g1_i1.p1 TRINITY_DN256_c0_g1~~TRINITY_DN256_c0_g1_i1.p1  ORF type:complete len:559 (+),score=219.61 TRINITY_DN256_c0_g1_i1:127-1803(+)
MDFDEGMGERDPGPLVYQEVKVFNTEPSLINVYDNTQLRFVTFEVYGLDTQSMLKLVYEYAQYDNLFRFNAELMNPNRKEGRFHWTIERLVITHENKDRKLKLGEKPTEEVAQLPTYETVRKIPTGRMDLKERQRLREQMDILDIRRTENIMRKRAATKERILKHIFFLKEEAVRRKQEQSDRMEAERQLRLRRKEDEEKKEEEALRLLDTKSRLRRKAIEAVENRNEEQEEFELAQLRLRWKAADDEKNRIISDALDRREKARAARTNAAEALRKKKSDAQNKRLMVWKNRDNRALQRDADWLKTIFDYKSEQARKFKMQRERNQEYLRDWDHLRHPLFHAQLARTEERAMARMAEQEAVNAYNEKRTVPKKLKKKGHAAKKAAAPAPAAEEKKDEKGDSKGTKKKKDDKKGEKHDKKESKKEEKAEDAEPKKSAKADVEKVLDSVENKVRAEMEEQRRRARMDKIRGEKYDELDRDRRAREAKHITDVKEKYRTAKLEESKIFQERVIVMREKDAEIASAKARKQQERERLDRARQANIERKEKLWLAKATGAAKA